MIASTSADTSQRPASSQAVVMRALMVAAAYALAGRLALLLALPPGYATAVWPAAGIAVGATLIWGPWMAVGVTVGSFVVNLPTGFDATDAGSLFLSVITPLCLGMGAGLQALAGRSLVRRMVGTELELVGIKEITLVLLFAGPVSALVASSWGIATLWAFGKLNLEAAPFNWWTWWVGDTVGVFVTLPLVLLWGESKHRRNRRTTLTLPLVGAFSLVIALYVYVSRLEQRRLQLDFENRTVHIEQAVRRSIETQVTVLQSLVGLYDSSREVDRKEFQRFVQHPLSHVDGLQALAWVERVSNADRSAFEQRSHDEGYWAFEIVQHNEQGELRRAPERDEYYAMTYIEPQAKNSPAFGFDVLSDPARGEAAIRARDTGLPSSTKLTQLLQSPFSYDGVLTYVPIFTDGVRPETLEARRQALRGFVVSIFRVTDLMNEALSGFDRAGIHVRLFDAAAPAGAQLLFEDLDAAQSPHETGDDARLQRRITFSVGGREWRLLLFVPESYLSANRSWSTWFFLAIGMLFVGMLGAFLLVVTGYGAHVEQLVEQRTHELKLSNEELAANRESLAIAQEIAHLGSWEMNIPKNQLTVSKELRTIMGLEFEVPLGVPSVLDRVHPDEQASLRQKFHDAAVKGVTVSEEYRVVRPDGDVRTVYGRIFTKADSQGNPVRLIGTALDITERKATEKRLKDSLQEKEVLLKEIHHRVKNNLQIVSSLLSLQSQQVRQVSDLPAYFEESQLRLRAMALAHEQIYQSDQLGRLDFVEYVRNVATNVFQTYGDIAARVALSVSGDQVAFDLDTAIPGGLLVAELVSNSLKHGFPQEKRGSVRVTVVRRSGLAEITVTDSGVGVAGDISFEGTKSFGLQLVWLLTKQLKATIEVKNRDGLEVKVAIPFLG